MLLLFAVLAGLFLMHGLSAGGVGGCHGTSTEMVAAKPMRDMQASSAMPADHAMGPGLAMGPDPATRADLVMSADMATRVDPARPASSSAAGSGESCIPLRPEGLSGLFLALFLIVIALWRPRLPHSARLIRPHWPHGPPRTGVQVLRTLNISRT